MSARFEKNVKGLTDYLAEVLIAKNRDYGDSFGKSVDEFGKTVILIRLNDKMNRLKTLLAGNEQQVDDESISDTLLDLAGYALLSLDKLDQMKEGEINE